MEQPTKLIKINYQKTTKIVDIKQIYFSKSSKARTEIAKLLNRTHYFFIPKAKVPFR
jgi:hypothetical protein